MRPSPVNFVQAVRKRIVQMYAEMWMRIIISSKEEKTRPAFSSNASWPTDILPKTCCPTDILLIQNLVDMGRPTLASLLALRRPNVVRPNDFRAESAGPKKWGKRDRILGAAKQSLKVKSQRGPSYAQDKCYKTFCVGNFLLFVISWSVCPWQHFPA